MNLYGDTTTLKGEAYLGQGITFGTDIDAQVLLLLEAASRMIDKQTNRFFYVNSTTRTFDGSPSPLYLTSDLLAVTTLKLDLDMDGTFEETMASTDYILYPLNKFPKTYIKIAPNGSFGSFAGSILQGVELAGNFGHGDGRRASPLDSLSVTITVADATTTTITVSADSVIKPGHTILAGTEQIFCSAVGTGSFTGERGVNGTTAAAQSTAATSLYIYPQTIIQAAYIQASRWYKRKDTAFVNVIGTGELGQLETNAGLDPDIRMIVDAYRKDNI
tara:strand:+ start:5318 stop:6142 length:825 start_codon:yes stop_codon:yes gene_type:complete